MANGPRATCGRCAKSAGHGPETDLEMTQIITVRKGKIIYQEYFWDHAEALEAVGLSEQDARADS